MPLDINYNTNNHKEVSEKYGEILGNTDQFYGKSLVCFIDLLGFSNSVYKNFGIDINSPIEKLKRIKNNVCATDLETKIVYCDSKWRPIFTYICKTRTMSDSIILFTGLSKSISSTEYYMATISMIASIYNIWHQALKEGFTIRGAIEFGNIYWDQNEIIGPAFIDAYNIENKICNYSRIIFGPAFVSEFLNYHYPNTQKVKDGSFMPFLIKNSDGLIGVDPIYLVKNKNFNSGQLLNNLIDMQLKSKIIKPKYGEKYNWLIKHLSSNQKFIPLEKKHFYNYTEHFDKLKT